MSNYESSDDTTLPLLTQPETDIEIPTETTTTHGTDISALDMQTSTSSLSEFSNWLSSGALAKHELRPCYHVLNRGRRLKLKTIAFRIDLINIILQLKPHSFLSSILTADVCVEKCQSTYPTYMNQPRKWNHAVVAKCICEIDTIINEARKW